MSKDKQVDIVQITSADHIVFGLGEDDKVYIWIQRDPNETPHWEVYNWELMRLT